MSVDENVDILAEKIALGGLLKYGYKAWTEVCDILTPESFVADTHTIAFQCLDYIFREKGNVSVDYVTLLSASKTLGFGDLLERKNEREYLKGLKNEHVEFSSVKSFAAKIRKLQLTRQIREQVQEIDRKLSEVKGEEKISEIMNIAEQPIFDFHQLLRGVEKTGPKAIFQDIKAYVKYLAENPVKQIGLETGFPTYDNAIGGGLIPGMVMMIGARRKKGKSVTCDNIASHVTSQLIPVCVLDTEMNHKMHYNRMLAMKSGVTINEIKTGQFAYDENKFKAVNLAADTLELLPYKYLNISGQEFEETLSEMRRWILTAVGLNQTGIANPCLIILDYLKLMTEKSIQHLAEYQRFGFMATEFTNFAIKYNVPCLSFIQLNRDEDFAQSDRVEWYFSSGAMLFEQSPEEIEHQRELGVEQPYNMKLAIQFVRDGEGLDSGDYINMMLHRNIAKFEEGPTQFQLENSTRNNSNQGRIVDDNDPTVDFGS